MRLARNVVTGLLERFRLSECPGNGRYEESKFCGPTCLRPLSNRACVCQEKAASRRQRMMVHRAYVKAALRADRRQKCEQGRLRSKRDNERTVEGDGVIAEHRHGS
jgi:hypothetical protein